LKLSWDETHPGPSGPKASQPRPQKQKCALSGRASGDYEEAAADSQEQSERFSRAAFLLAPPAQQFRNKGLFDSVTPEDSCS